MNSFLFRIILTLFVFVFSLNTVKGQAGYSSGRPLHPLNLFREVPDRQSFLQISYTSPYGVRAFSDINLEYSNMQFGGILKANISTRGARGISDYNFGFGYGLGLTEQWTLGLGLSIGIMTTFSAGTYKLFPGGSAYSDYYGSDRLRFSFRLSNWTSLFGQRKVPESLRTAVSIIVMFTRHDKVRLVTGFSYRRGRLPVFCAGTGIIASSNHAIYAGLDTSPGGFWLGYSYYARSLNFRFTLKTSGVFGLEPGTSFQYFLNDSGF